MERLFFLLYSIFATLIYLISLPFFLLLSFKSKYRQSIPARFFLFKNSPIDSNGLWFHSCSFGEAKAIAPIVEELPKDLLRMTTTTSTGFEVINSYTNQSRFLPFESLLFGWLKPQKVLVVMEAEFWYLLFSLSKFKGTKTILINARMSDRSFHKYMRIKWLYKEIFKYIDEVYAQSLEDKRRLELLGASNIVVTGNIKLSKLPKVTKDLVKPKGLVLCAASTHDGEEEVVLNSFKEFKKENVDAKLIVVPRHPQRFKQVSKMVQEFCKEKYSWHNYSDNDSLDSDIIVIDKLGELVNMYSISDIVILGGAFAPIGGHNAAEAAQFGCKIISGPNYFNQRDLFESIEGITIVTKENLSKRLLQHGLLKKTKILQKTDISPIIDSIKKEI